MWRNLQISHVIDKAIDCPKPAGGKVLLLKTKSKQLIEDRKVFFSRKTDAFLEALPRWWISMVLGVPRKKLNTSRATNFSVYNAGILVTQIYEIKQPVFNRI